MSVIRLDNQIVSCPIGRDTILIISLKEIPPLICEVGKITSCFKDVILRQNLLNQCVMNNEANTSAETTTLTPASVVPKFRLVGGIKDLVVEKSTPSTNNPESVCIKFVETISGDNMEGITSEDGTDLGLGAAPQTKCWYFWANKALNPGTKAKINFDLFVIKRVEDEIVDDAGDNMTVTRDVLEIRKGHVSGL
jgi:hypothetical protein